MGMYHSTSGKRGYRVHFHPTPWQLDREQARAVLEAEDALRASKEYQDKYSEQDSLDWLKQVTLEIQTKALAAHGFGPCYISALHNVRSQYGEDPAVKALSVYMRQDKSRKGDLCVGDALPNCNLHYLDGTATTLHDYIAALKIKNQPCFVDLLNKIATEQTGIDIVTIYILEAHASDEWPIGNLVTVKQHKTLQDRLEAAKSLRSEYGYNLPVLVDAMDNNFNAIFAAWPERYYVVRNNSLVRIDEPVLESGFDRQALTLYLAEMVASSTSA